MTISRGQMPRQLYLGGGITQLPVDQMMVPRGQYGLGSIVKSITRPVKKAVKAVGDFASSDVGKMALLAAAGFGIPGTQFGGLFGRAAFGGQATGLFGTQGIGQALSLAKTNIGNVLLGTPGDMGGRVADGLLSKIPGGMATAAAVGGSLLAGLFGGSEEEAAAAFKRDPQGVKNYLIQYFKNLNKDATDEEAAKFAEEQTREYAAGGGIMGLPMGEMRTNKAGVMERDYREEGGFVPVGIKEKADDVPAMLSRNEFVFTADAVRGAGDGNVEKGAQRLYNTMKTLENGGTV